MARTKKSTTKKYTPKVLDAKTVKKNQLAESRTLNKDAEEVETEEEEGKAEFFRENP
jgi:hypothetical protein